MPAGRADSRRRKPLCWRPLRVLGLLRRPGGPRRRLVHADRGATSRQHRRQLRHLLLLARREALPLARRGGSTLRTRPRRSSGAARLRPRLHLRLRLRLRRGEQLDHVRGPRHGETLERAPLTRRSGGGGGGGEGGGDRGARRREGRQRAESARLCDLALARDGRERALIVEVGDDVGGHRALLARGEEEADVAAALCRAVVPLWAAHGAAPVGGSREGQRHLGQLQLALGPILALQLAAQGLDEGCARPLDEAAEGLGLRCGLRGGGCAQLGAKRLRGHVEWVHVGGRAAGGACGGEAHEELLDTGAVVRLVLLFLRRRRLALDGLGRRRLRRRGLLALDELRQP
mmetsp:Transcript_7734/g.24440  ORF Transcript_7734/g.24440 Transcript_7734/m.24440 type:complete len:346 (+) Transcript_7734:162-1199(+)